MQASKEHLEGLDRAAAAPALQPALKALPGKNVYGKRTVDKGWMYRSHAVDFREQAARVIVRVRFRIGVRVRARVMVGDICRLCNKNRNMNETFILEMSGINMRNLMAEGECALPRVRYRLPYAW